MAHVDGGVNDPKQNGVFGGNDSPLEAPPSGPPVGNGVFGFSNVPNASGVCGANNGGGHGVFGIASGIGFGSGVIGMGPRHGVVGVTGSGSDSGVFGRNERKGFGVFGLSEGGFGVFGRSAEGTGVHGHGGGISPGVSGFSEEGVAGLFFGDLFATRYVIKAAGAFEIDHPLDPANKYLLHSFVESPDMMNIYNGNVVTDADGEAAVTLPDYFEALNRDFRYQLTVIGTFAQAIIASEIADGRFTIKTDQPTVKVSWQVTGVRQDRFADKNRINVEQAKPEAERGFYLHPELFDAPAQQGIAWALRPDAMRLIQGAQERLKETPAQSFALADRATGSPAEG